MAYNEEQALGFLKARLNRPATNHSIDEYLKARLRAADKSLERAGIRLREEDTGDLMLLVDYTEWQYKNRDKPGGMPEWLRLARRERWLAERRDTP